MEDGAAPARAAATRRSILAAGFPPGQRSGGTVPQAGAADRRGRLQGAARGGRTGRPTDAAGGRPLVRT